MINLKNDFDEARAAYPGTVRGLDTEYGYYLTCLKRKRLKEYEITPNLLPAIQAQIQAREGKDWNPGWKHFKTWLYNSWWEAVDCKGAKPPVLCCVCNKNEWSIQYMNKPLCSNPACRRSVRGY